jgi:diguanylate cyclase (GGDEF)-like protein
MPIDQPTLAAGAAFANAICGIMLMFFWLQDRRAATLCLWGAALLAMCAGAIVLCLRGLIPLSASVSAGGALCLIAYGLMWAGARAFAGRVVAPAIVVVGAAIWIAACLSPTFLSEMTTRVAVFSFLTCIYTLMTLWEYRQIRERDLRSRRPAIALLAIHAALLGSRVAFAGILPFPVVVQGPAPAWVSIGVALLLAHYLSMAFLVTGMVKERQTAQHRAAALRDPLTGVANRRAFFERGVPLLAETLAAGQPAALLVLDLDQFKRVNDTFGHEAGDRVLCDFCATALPLLRVGDLFGRTGGEEFACLLPGASAIEAVRVAERVRAAFAMLTAESGGPYSTVSIGVATSDEVGGELRMLLAAADRALYRAKEQGRNRVEAAWTAKAA